MSIQDSPDKYKHIDVKDSHFVYPVGWLYNTGMVVVLLGLGTIIYSIVFAVPDGNISNSKAVLIFLAGVLLIIFAWLINGLIGVKCPQCNNKTRVVTENNIVNFYCDSCKIHMHCTRPQGD